jgi:hypothetical protein
MLLKFRNRVAVLNDSSEQEKENKQIKIKNKKGK